MRRNFSTVWTHWIIKFELMLEKKRVFASIRCEMRVTFYGPQALFPFYIVKDQIRTFVFSR